MSVRMYAEIPVLYKAQWNVVTLAKVDLENEWLGEFQWYISDTRRPASPRTRIGGDYLLLNRLVAVLSYVEPARRRQFLLEELEQVKEQNRHFPKVVSVIIPADPFDCRVNALKWHHSPRAVKQRERKMSLQAYELPLSALRSEQVSSIELSRPQPSPYHEPITGSSEQGLETPEAMMEVLQKLRLEERAEEQKVADVVSRPPVVLETNSDALAYVKALYSGSKESNVPESRG